jgi:hypothetical protein
MENFIQEHSYLSMSAKRDHTGGAGSVVTPTSWAQGFMERIAAVAGSCGRLGSHSS